LIIHISETLFPAESILMVGDLTGFEVIGFYNGRLWVLLLVNLLICRFVKRNPFNLVS
jgi:hypothetical protein